MRTVFACLVVVGLAAPLVAASPAAAASACTTYTPVPRPPKSLHCGQYGTLKTPEYLRQTGSPKTLSKCQQACATDASCLSFGFDSTAKTCELFGKSLDNQGFKETTSGAYIYYNIHCFKCKTSTATSTTITSSSSSSPVCVPTEYVDNGSFETVVGDDEAASWGYSGSVDENGNSVATVEDEGSSNSAESGFHFEQLAENTDSSENTGSSTARVSSYSETVYQAITGLTVGESYTLTYYYRARFNTEGSACTADVTLDEFQQSLDLTSTSDYVKGTGTLTYRNVNNVLTFTLKCSAIAHEGIVLNLDNVSLLNC